MDPILSPGDQKARGPQTEGSQPYRRGELNNRSRRREEADFGFKRSSPSSRRRLRPLERSLNSPSLWNDPRSWFVCVEMFSLATILLLAVPAHAQHLGVTCGWS